MRERDFEEWLRRHYRTRTGELLDPRSQSTTLSNCRRVEAAEGDLDSHFARDGLDGVLGRLALGKTQIRIDGDRDNVLSSLKSAVTLYESFCRRWPTRAPAPSLGSNQERPPPRPAAPAATRRPRAHGVAAWPTWEQPGDADLLSLARALTPLVRFLHPDIVRAVVEDNETHHGEWSAALGRHGVDPQRYLWPRGACAFPGIRRYAGSMEVARHRGRAEATSERPAHALATDDNNYPKHLWSFVLRGRPFQQFGPPGYALAHLLDHKDYKSRFSSELRDAKALAERTPYGLYTCPTNTVYVPQGFLRPTDHAGLLRGLMQRRAQDLYGSVCDLVPQPASIGPAPNPEWESSAFHWGEPVVAREPLERFLTFRRERVEALLRERPA